MQLMKRVIVLVIILLVLYLTIYLLMLYSLFPTWTHAPLLALAKVLPDVTVPYMIICWLVPYVSVLIWSMVNQSRSEQDGELVKRRAVTHRAFFGNHMLLVVGPICLCLANYLVASCRIYGTEGIAIILLTTMGWSLMMAGAWGRVLLKVLGIIAVLADLHYSLRFAFFHSELPNVYTFISIHVVASVGLFFLFTGLRTVICQRAGERQH